MFVLRSVCIICYSTNNQFITQTVKLLRFENSKLEFYLPKKESAQFATGIKEFPEANTTFLCMSFVEDRGSGSGSGSDKNGNVERAQTIERENEDGRLSFCPATCQIHRSILF